MRPPLLFELFAGLDTIKGIGPHSLKLLKNLCGHTIVSALFHLPNTILDRMKPPYLTTEVTVLKHQIPRLKKLPYKVLCQFDKQLLEIIYFTYYKDYLLKMLPINSKRFVSGKVSSFNSHLQMNHPDYITQEKKSIPLIEPIYPLSQGLTNKMMIKVIEESLKCIPKMPEWLDEHFLKQQNWTSFKESLIKIHHPENIQDIDLLSKERARLAYDELLANQLALALVRRQNKKKKGPRFQCIDNLVKTVLNNLPFELTIAQKRVFEEIKKDMDSSYCMTRLLQGDVGSGKTVVGLLSMLHAIECGQQTCLMAPTDILARQHMSTITKLCKNIQIQPILLTSREKGNVRQNILDAIADGSGKIIIGTHALFQEPIKFKELGFIIIDEQHRFGVEQRLSLAKKGNNPDILVMTATPIPRSLALTYYGDMDISKIDEKPPHRQKIDTRIIPFSKIDETIQKLENAINSNSQIYWVCPLIEESEKSDLANVTNRFKSLEKKFPHQVALIHGKMKGEEKDAIMNDFVLKKTKILVATTVIEVGVDVPSATIMIIEQAERFGLAQLHQLRGRIGRGERPSTCLLIYNTPLSIIAKKRLQIMRETQDGFIIAEEDLKLRGAGEVLGTKQSGIQDFKLADLSVHANLLTIARDDVRLILNTDAHLENQRGEALKILLHLFNQETKINTIHSG